MNQKKLKGQLTILVVMIIILAVLLLWRKTSGDNTLTVGIFYGSNWDVPGTQYHKILDAAIEKLQEEYPGLEVKYVKGVLEEDYSEWLSEMIVEGDTPDIFLVKQDDLYTLASMGALQRLESQILTDLDFSSEVFYKNAYDTGNVSGGQYTLPFECNTKLMFVNKTLLSKNGVEMPDDDWNWEEFYNLCNTLTKDTDGDGQLDQFGYYNYSLEDSMIANQVELLTASENTGSAENIIQTKTTWKPNLLDEKLSETLQYQSRLREIYQNYEVNAEEFDLGHVAFRPLTLAEYRTYMPYPWRIKKYSSFEWNCVQMPAGTSGDNNAELETLMVGMSAKTKKPKRAWKLMKLLTMDEEIQSMIYEYSAGASPLKSVTNSEETLALLNEDTPGDSHIDMSLLDSTLENAVSFSKKYEGYEEIIAEIEEKLEQYLESGEQSSIELYNLNEEVRNMMNQ